jgi:FKBP-type peptidyl-prolyl cis-trans isomerase FklB
MMIRKGVFFITLLSLSLATLCVAQKKNKKSKSMTTEKKLNTIDSLSYSLGVSIGKNLKAQGLDSLNTEMIGQAFSDVFKNVPLLIAPEKAEQLLTEYFTNLQKVKFEKNIKEGQQFLEENKKKPGVVTTESGLQYLVIKEGTGEMPKATDKVSTHYHGTLIDGTVFDSSVERGQPVSFPVNQVIPGWTEALQLMKTGSKWKLFIPSNLGYGERGSGPKIGPNSTLVFEVELLAIEK